MQEKAQKLSEGVLWFAAPSPIFFKRPGTYSCWVALLVPTLFDLLLCFGFPFYSVGKHLKPKQSLDIGIE